MGFSNSPFVKYWQAIKASPPGIYNRRLFLTVFVYALAGSPRGWDEGSTSAITQLKSFQHDFGITPTGSPEAVSNIVSLVNLTAGLGALLSFLVNDAVGRRWSLRIYCTVAAAGAVISTVSGGSLGALYAGRLVSGLGIGALTVTGPMSIVEVAPPVTRGLMTLWFNIAMLSSQMVGIFVVYGAGRHIPDTRRLQWQAPFFVQTFVPALAVLLSFAVDESPRWLCLQGRPEAARDALARLRGFAPDSLQLAAEFASIHTPIQRELREYGGKETIWSTLRETFGVRANARRVQLTVAAYVLAQLSGANAVTNYLPTIFGYLGVEGPDAAQVYSSGLYALAKLVCCVLASLVLVDAVGRRKSLFVGITVQMGCHAYLGAFLKVLGDRETVSKGADEAAIAAIYIHALGWAVGLYSLPYLFGAELWPNRIRSFGGALSQCFHWLFLFAITKATPALLSAMDRWGAFVFFAAWCLAALAYCFVMVPETSGRSLESMDRLFEHRWYEMRKYAYEGSTVAAMGDEKPDGDVEQADVQREQPK